MEREEREMEIKGTIKNPKRDDSDVGHARPQGGRREDHISLFLLRLPENAGVYYHSIKFSEK